MALVETKRPTYFPSRVSRVSGDRWGEGGVAVALRSSLAVATGWVLCSEDRRHRDNGKTTRCTAAERFLKGGSACWLDGMYMLFSLLPCTELMFLFSGLCFAQRYCLYVGCSVQLCCHVFT